MLTLLLTARWPAAVLLLLAIVALVIAGSIMAGQAIDDVGSWRWSSWRPV